MVPLSEAWSLLLRQMILILSNGLGFLAFDKIIMTIFDNTIQTYTNLVLLIA